MPEKVLQSMFWGVEVKSHVDIYNTVAKLPGSLNGDMINDPNPDVVR